MLALRVVTALGAALAVAPAAGAVEAYRCSANGGPEWHAYRSKHFVVETDLARARAQELVGRLEKMQALVLKALVGGDVEEPPGRVHVVAVQDPGLFASLAGRDDVDGYWTTSRAGEGAIVLGGRGLQSLPETVAHEYAHHLSWSLFPRQPSWFSEGLAQFVETVATGDVAREIATGTHIGRGAAAPRGGAAGLASRALVDFLGQARPVPVEELLAWKGSMQDDAFGSLHAWSWLLYHWLWNNRSKQLADYGNRLSAAEEPAAAWRAAFPEFDPGKPAALAALDESLEKYRRDGRYAYYTVTAAYDATAQESALAPADVHALLVDIRHAGGAGVRADVEEALREDPAQPLAIVVRAELDKASPVEALRAATVARPGDARAWLFLAEHLGATAASEKEAALRKAVALDPDGARAQNALAWLLVGSGRAREALPFANRAVDLAPWEPGVIDTYATVAAALGQCRAAGVLERRAIALVPPGSTAAADLEKRLAQLEQRCVPAAVKAR